MDSVDREFLGVMLEDLGYLQSEWSAGDLSDDMVRRNSGLLRRLLVDNDLHKAWTAVMGRVPLVIPANTLEPPDAEAVRWLEYATASGVAQPGMITYQAIAIRGPIDEGPFPVVIKSAIPLRINQFREGYCVVIDGTFVRRREVVQYMANKAGGVHFDTDRSKPSDQAVQAMKRFEIAGRGGVYFELLGIGQAIAQAPDVDRLVQQLTSDLE